jgi:subtilisin family serine protease
MTKYSTDTLEFLRGPSLNTSAALLTLNTSRRKQPAHKYCNIFLISSGFSDVIYQIEYEQGDESLAAREVQDESSHLTGRAANGGGVDIYSIDTGVLTTHTAFGGRATWGATYGGYASRDGNGHGTRTSYALGCMSWH